MEKKETVLVLGSHSDDFVIGAGGTIANYTKEGKKVLSIVFSYGEKSHPWLKGNVVKKIRLKEALEASRLLGCQTIFFDLEEMKFYEDYKKKEVEKELLKIINRNKPTKIFTHSNEDPHPDHRAIHKITQELLKKVTFRPELYVYSIWNPVSIRTSWPALYIKISKTFSLKLKALKMFRSQKFHVAYPFFLLLFRAIKNGLKVRTLFAEKFYRIK